MTGVKQLVFKKRRAIRARGGVNHIAQGRVFNSHERGSEEGPKGREKLMMSEERGHFLKQVLQKGWSTKSLRHRLQVHLGWGGRAAGKGEGGGADSAHCAPGALSFSPF